MTPDYFASIRRAESGGNDAARNPRSTATGRYQFIESTWNQLARQYPHLGLTPDGRTDPEQQERAVRAFTSDNAAALRRAGIDTTPANLYAAHFLGAGGAVSVLGKPDNTPLAAVLPDAVIRANPNLRGMTVADFRRMTARAGGGAVGPVETAPAAAGANALAAAAPAQTPPPFEMRRSRLDPRAFQQDWNALAAMPVAPITPMNALARLA